MIKPRATINKILLRLVDGISVDMGVGETVGTIVGEAVGNEVFVAVGADVCVGEIGVRVGEPGDTKLSPGTVRFIISTKYSLSQFMFSLRP